MTADEKESMKNFVGETLQRCHEENLAKEKFEHERIEDLMPDAMRLVNNLRSKNMEYKLIVPITKPNGEKIETVTVRESYTGRDIKAIGNAGGEGSAMIALVAAATGQSENVVLNMDARDVREIGAIAKPFLAGGEA